MEQYINTTDIVEYKENKIDVHWMRNAYKKKTTVRLFPEDDGIVTVEKDYIIFTYKTPHLSYLFNKNLFDIEELIEKKLNKHYSVISVPEEKWEIIKQEFNTKSKVYNYILESSDSMEVLRKLKNDSTDDMTNLFGNLVEYK